VADLLVVAFAEVLVLPGAVVAFLGAVAGGVVAVCAELRIMLLATRPTNNIGFWQNFK
jgi:hypothetical protein